MKSCIYIGMASDDVDVSELVETIAATAREIEENSRVRRLMGVSFISGFPLGRRLGSRRTMLPPATSVHSFLACAYIRASSELGCVPEAGMLADWTQSLPPGEPTYGSQRGSG